MHCSTLASRHSDISRALQQGTNNDGQKIVSAGFDGADNAIRNRPNDHRSLCDRRCPAAAQRRSSAAARQRRPCFPSPEWGCSTLGAAESTSVGIRWRRFTTQSHAPPMRRTRDAPELGGQAWAPSSTTDDRSIQRIETRTMPFWLFWRAISSRDRRAPSEHHVCSTQSQRTHWQYQQ